MSSVGIAVILLSAIVKGSVGTKREANNDSAIADSHHKKEKSMMCHDVYCLGTNIDFLKMSVLIKVFELTSNHLTATFLNFVTSLMDTSFDLFLYLVHR